KQNEQKHQVQEFYAQVQDLKKQLYATREQLRQARLDDRHLDSTQITSLVKELRDDGKLLDYVEQAVEDKQQHVANYNDLLISAARTFMNDRADYRNYVYYQLLPAVKAEQVAVFMILAGRGEERIPLTVVASLRASLHMRMRQKQLIDSLPEFLLDDKSDAHRFIDEIGVRRPNVSAEI